MRTFRFCTALGIAALQLGCLPVALRDGALHRASQARTQPFVVVTAGSQDPVPIETHADDTFPVDSPVVVYEVRQGWHCTSDNCLPCIPALCPPPPPPPWPQPLRALMDRRVRTVAMADNTATIELEKAEGAITFLYDSKYDGDTSWKTDELRLTVPITGTLVVLETRALAACGDACLPCDDPRARGIVCPPPPPPPFPRLHFWLRKSTTAR